MASIGLLGKAIEYYNASGKGYSEECKELERLVFKSKKKIKENTRIISSSSHKNQEIMERDADIGYLELIIPDSVPAYTFTLELENEIKGKN